MQWLRKSIEKLGMKDMRIGITMGDPAGIGPEIILKSLSKEQNLANIKIFANQNIMRKTARDLGMTRAYYHVKKSIVDCITDVDFLYGKSTKETGRAALATINYALKQNLDVLVTAPIVKETIRESISNFTGHTEYLASYFNAKKFAMVGLVKQKRIMLLTTHIPLRDVTKYINATEVFNKIMFFEHGLRFFFGKKKPSIGISAVNPHGFEFSNGEDEEIARGIQRARATGVSASGPFAADSLFNRSFDGYLVMYHDQAFIYLKSKKDGVNFTMGLPIIRLSPLYGAALDIAGKNCAEFSGMTAALMVGCRIFERTRG